jgi:hypothetical protein
MYGNQMGRLTNLRKNLAVLSMESPASCDEMTVWRTNLA